MITLRILNLFFIVIALASCIVFWRKFHVPAMIAPISWLVNAAAFYIVRIVGFSMEITVINLWSSTLHLHACFLIISALIIFWPKEHKP